MPKNAKGPRLSPVSDQMKAWSGALADEVTGWPGVSLRSFFGFTAMYRRDRIFGVLPRTRSWGTGNCIAFKLETPGPTLRARLKKDPRIGSMQMQKSRWFTVELSSDRDLHHALEWLGRAYQPVRKPKKPRS